MPNEPNKKPETAADRQYDDLLNSAVAKFGEQLDTLTKAQADALKNQAAEIARVETSLREHQADARKRWATIADHYKSGGPYVGPYGDMATAKQAGQVFLAQLRNPGLSMDKAIASLSGQTGEGGGAITVETMIAGIVRNVEQFGVYERNAMSAEQPSQGSKIIKRTGGLNVYYRDLGVAATGSAPTFAMIKPELQTYSVYVPVDKHMFEDTLVVALADFIAMETALALAEATDTNAFMGDGTSAYARVQGLFKRAGGADVVAASGDDTFQEVIDESVTYLSQALGGIPQHGDDGNLKIYAHRSILFAYMGVKDSQDRPLLNFLQGAGSGNRLQAMLMGYPVEVTQVAPRLSDTAVSTAMLVAANLQRGSALARHTSGITFETSRDYKFAEGEVSILVEVRQDIVGLDDNLHGRLVTASG